MRAASNSSLLCRWFAARLSRRENKAMSIDGTEFPAEEVSELESLHRIECGCGNILLVRERDLGRTLQCPACEELVYIAHELATPTGQQTHSRHYDDDEVPADLQPGDRFMATYEVRELIGRGGMAYVHRVHHKGWGIDLALKTPRPDLVWRNDWQRDFERECETWVGLTPHPNVVRCHYIRRLGGIPRLFLEFVSGGSVVHWTRHKLLYRGDPEEVLKRVLDVAMQIAWGLNHAHEQGLVHQDVKLGNVLMTRDGQAKVTDFGLMRAFGASNAVSTFYPTSGTPAYSAPEQGPETPPSHLADIWGWGASVLEMCVGTLRWVDHVSLLKLFDAYRANRLERTRIANMPEPLAELLQDCFRTKPEDRPGSMHRVMESLREVYQWTFGIPYDRKPPKAELASAEVLNNRAISLFELGKQQEAEILWQQAMALAPGQLETRFNNLLYEWRTGRCTDIVVIRSLMELMEKENRSPQSRYLLAGVMVVRRVGEYAVMRPAREMLFTTVDAESRYKAKNFIDTAVYRGGDALSAWVKTGLDLLGHGSSFVALVGALLATGRSHRTPCGLGRARKQDDGGKCQEVRGEKRQPIHREGLVEHHGMALSVKVARAWRALQRVRSRCARRREASVQPR